MGRLVSQSEDEKKPAELSVSTRNIIILAYIACLSGNKRQENILAYNNFAFRLFHYRLQQDPTPITVEHPGITANCTQSYLVDY